MCCDSLHKCSIIRELVSTQSSSFSEFANAKAQIKVTRKCAVANLERGTLYSIGCLYWLMQLILCVINNACMHSFDVHNSSM